MSDVVFANGDTATFQNGDVATFGHSPRPHVRTDDRVVAQPSLLPAGRKTTGPQEVDQDHPYITAPYDVFTFRDEVMAGVDSGLMDTPDATSADYSFTRDGQYNYLDMANNNRGYVSARSVLPPKNITMFGIARYTPSWTQAQSFVCGFLLTETGSGYINQGKASVSLTSHVDFFGDKIIRAGITYSDATHDEVYLAGPGAEDDDPYFVALSFKDKSELILLAKNLATGAIWSSSRAETKSLNQVEQPLQVGMHYPYYPGTDWARASYREIAYAGYTAQALSVEQLTDLANDPYQIIKPAASINPTNQIITTAAAADDRVWLV
jgi:hypothetical protein